MKKKFKKQLFQVQKTYESSQNNRIFTDNIKKLRKKISFRFTFHVKTASFSKFQFFHPQIQRTTS